MHLKGGVSHRSQSDSVEDVIKRAEYYLSNPDNWENYHLLFNSCGSYAVYCKTKWKISRQVSGNDIAGEVTAIDDELVTDAPKFLYTTGLKP